MCTYGVANGLVCWIMPNGEVRVVERLLAADTPGRIEAKHARQQINGKRVGLGEQRREGDTGSDG